MARKEERNPSAADSEGEEEVYEVEKIVGHRVSFIGLRKAVQFICFRQDNYDAKQRVSYEFREFGLVSKFVFDASILLTPDLLS